MNFECVSGPPIPNCCTSDAQCNSGDQCNADLCVGNSCTKVPVPNGTICDGGLCNGQGACIGVCSGPGFGSCQGITFQTTTGPQTGCCGTPANPQFNECNVSDPVTGATCYCDYICCEFGDCCQSVVCGY